MALSGAKLAGGNPKNCRVENDFYATDPVAVKKLLYKYGIKGNEILEPCIGMGHIAETIKNFYNSPIHITGLDIEDRGYPDTIVHDYLTWETDKKFDCIITNPPFSLAKEFIEKSFSLLTDDVNEDNTPIGQVIMFLKIQFLEGEKRKELFEQYPPKYIYVFRKRMPTWNNGNSCDENGKRWATTICHAWFVWEKGNKEEPIIRWLD